MAIKHWRVAEAALSASSLLWGFNASGYPGPCDVTCPQGSTIDPEACDLNFDPCTPACGGSSGNCCFGGDQPGCEDPVCADSVCAIDSFCCDVRWDAICAAEACGHPNCDCVPFSVDPLDIFCGDVICGTLRANNGLQDTDWFILHASGGPVTINVQTNMPAICRIADTPCSGTVLAEGTGACPGGVTINVDLPPGGYGLLIAASVIDGFPCGSGSNDYVATIICAPPCPSDINRDNETDVDDLLIVIQNWNGGPGIPGDVTQGDGVNIDDLLWVIAPWGRCPR